MVILEVRSVLFLSRRDQVLISFGQGASDPLGEAETNLFIQSPYNEGFSRMEIRQTDIIDPVRRIRNQTNTGIPVDLPLGPLPSKAKIAQMMREPVQEPMSQFQIHRADIAVRKANGTAQTGCNRCRRDLAGLGQD